MSSEESILSEFHGFTQASNFDCSYAYFINNSCNHKKSSKESADLSKYEMFSSNLISINETETSEQNLGLNQNELSKSSWNSSCLQANSNIFNVLQRPPVVVDVQLEESSPKRRKLVYAPISPVPQTNTPLKIISNKSEEKSTVVKNDVIYNTYSKNRGRWDMLKSVAKTEQLLGHYFTNMLTYNDVGTPEKPEDATEMTIDISIKTDETPKSVTSKTDGSNNESTPTKSNDESTCEMKTVAAVKISPPFLSMENSNNATDNSIKIMEKLNLKSGLCHEFMGPLSFENKIPKIKNKVKPKYSETSKSEFFSGGNLLKPEMDNYQCAPASPCLFSSEDSEDEDVDLANSIGFMNKTPQDVERDRLKQNDLALLKRLQKTLSGVLPPPAVTITQLDLSQILDLYKTNLSSHENGSSQQFTPRKRTLTDSILDNNSSMTPPFKTSISLPEGFDALKFSESESLSAVPRSDSALSLQNSSMADVSNSLLISCTLDDVLKASWPDVMDCRYHGVHYNRSSVSEEFELLCMKFSERYIGAETQTSCTLGNKPYSKKSTVSRYTQSPGRRLSHLARRRQTFSSANLQAGCSLEVNTRKPVTSARQIMLSTKRTDNTARRRYKPIPTRRTPGRKTPGKKTPGRKTPGRKTPSRKTPGKKTPGKATPSTSTKKRKLVCRRIISEEHESSSSCSSSSVKPTRESSKRALFQSPPRIRGNESNNDLSRNEFSSFGFGLDKIQRPKRTLFTSPIKKGDMCSDSNCDMKKRVNLNSANMATTSLLSPFKNETSSKRKRKFSEICDSASQDSPKSKFPRSLSFNTAPLGGKVLTRRASENVVSSSSRQNSNCELSDNHKKKLLWAVAEALRSQNIGLSHPQFKSHASVLARLTRKLLMEDAQRTGSTSEKMLRLAKLHVFSVIKGKTVEEIMIEEHIRKAKACSSKVTGYVPLSEYEQNKISALNQRLIKPKIKVGKFCGNVKSDQITSGSDSNTLSDFRSYSDLESGNSLTKSVLQDKSLNLDNSLLNPKIKARRQICFDDCAKR